MDPSPERLPFGCVERCPACRHRTWDPDQSENQKREWIMRTLSREPALAATVGAVVGPVRGVRGERRWHYRERVTLRAQWEQETGWGFGMLLGSGFRREEPEFVPIPDCPVHSERVRVVLRILAEELRGVGPELMPLAFVVISGTLVTLVVKGRSRPDGLAANSRLVERLATVGLTGLFLNLNPSAGDRVMSSRGWVHLWGQARSEWDFRGRKVVSGPDSFQQLIPELYGMAVAEAEEFLSPRAGDSVVDLCSGIGLTLHHWKERGARTLGVELGGESVECANMNAGEGLCLRGRCSDRLPQLKAWLSEASGDRVLVFANPPRLGLEPEVVQWLARESGAARIAYLSCSAGTLARDLSVLSEAGYALHRITPYDFFPQTHHVETLALLAKS